MPRSVFTVRERREKEGRARSDFPHTRRKRKERKSGLFCSLLPPIEEEEKGAKARRTPKK